MRPISRLITPEQFDAIERMKQCEVDVVTALKKYDCRLSMRDIVIDGRTVDRLVMPLPVGMDIAAMWQLYDREVASVNKMFVDEKPTPAG